VLFALLLSTGYARAAESVAVHVQGVVATRGEKQLTPTVAPSLKEYADLLKRFPYDKFEDIGGGDGVATTGQATSIKVGSHSIDVTLVEMEKGAAKIKYTVKDSKDQPIGSNVMVLAPGQIVPVQIGEPAFPIILLFQTK
jgi:hypothetical protein